MIGSMPAVDSKSRNPSPAPLEHDHQDPVGRRHRQQVDTIASIAITIDRKAKASAGSRSPHEGEHAAGATSAAGSSKSRDSGCAGEVRVGVGSARPWPADPVAQRVEGGVDASSCRRRRSGVNLGDRAVRVDGDIDRLVHLPLARACSAAPDRLLHLGPATSAASTTTTAGISVPGKAA